MPRLCSFSKIVNTQSQLLYLWQTPPLTKSTEAHAALLYYIQQGITYELRIRNLPIIKDSDTPAYGHTIELATVQVWGAKIGPRWLQRPINMPRGGGV